MHSFTRVLFAGAAVSAAVISSYAAEPAKQVVPRFSAANMDPTVSPATDFARYAWGNWRQNNPVPADRARWSSFHELDQYNQNGLKGILETVAAKPHEPGSLEQKVGDFYTSAMDTAEIDAAGLKPAETDLAQVAAIKSMDDLAKTLAALHNAGVGGLFVVLTEADEKNSSMTILGAGQGGMSLPSRDYYFDEKFAPQRAAFLEHVAKMFTLAGDTPEAAAANAKVVFEAEKGLAEKARTPVELRDPIANYNKMPTTELAAKFPAFPFATYLAERGIGGPAAAEVDVGVPPFFEGLQVQLTSRPLSDWKAYLRFHVLRTAAPYLSSAFEEESFHFNGTVLTGAPAMQPRWQRSMRVLDAQLGEALGQLYVAQYYPPEAETRMKEMIANILAVLHDRIQKLDWMSDATKQKALAKFDRYLRQDRSPGEVARLRDGERQARQLLRQRPCRDRVRDQAQARPTRPAGGQGGVGDDAADGERLLRPDGEHHQLPGGHPAAALLRLHAR